MSRNIHRTSTKSRAILLAMMLSVMAQPVFADVKAGVDAWGRGDYNAAVKEWRDPALKGDADAQFNLGQAYKMGRGVTKVDLAIALDWYRKAASQGHLQAADSIGHLLHYQGNVADSLQYLEASSDRGEPRAQYLLGTELFNGVYTEKDWVRAYALMTRASSSGMALASRSLAQMDQYIPLEQRQQGVAMAEVLEKRANANRSAQISGFPINTKPPVASTRPIPVPPSSEQQAPVAGDDEYAFRPEAPAPKAKPPVKIASPKPVATPKPKAAIAAQPMPTAKSSGGWRIQLGAFGNEGNAKSLWNQLVGKIDGLSSLTPFLRAAGSVTRLQAGPFASRSAAEASCAKVKAAGQACIAVTN